MQGISKSGFFAYGMVLTFPLLLISCASTPETVVPRRPLTEKELSVKIEQGDQAATLRLNKTCKGVGRIETLSDANDKYYNDGYDKYDIKVRTVAAGANVVQILYTRGEMYDVRFWACPE